MYDTNKANPKPNPKPKPTRQSTHWLTSVLLSRTQQCVPTTFSNTWYGLTGGGEAKRGVREGSDYGKIKANVIRKHKGIIGGMYVRFGIHRGFYVACHGGIVTTTTASTNHRTDNGFPLNDLDLSGQM